MSANRDPESLLDILQNARLIQEFAAGLTIETLASDRKTQYAIVRCIEIIGEATKRLSDGFRLSHALINWKEIAGMRDRIIHQYDTVDLTIVWDVIKHEIASLIAYIEPLIPPDTDDDEPPTETNES